MMRSKTIGVLGIAAGLAAGLFAAQAAENDAVAARQLSGSKLGFLLKEPYSAATPTVFGPNQFNASAFSRSGAVAIDLRKFGEVEDGAHGYQITAASEIKVKNRLGLDNGRGERGAPEQLEGIAINGTFHVKDGKIVAAGDGTPSEKNDRNAK